MIVCIDEKALATSSRFFKEGEAAKVHGVKMTDISKIGKESFKQIKELPKQKIFDLCGDLWKSGYLEESVIACIWAESLHKQYEETTKLKCRYEIQQCTTYN